MKMIIRNIFVGILLLTVWGLIISGTVSMARAQMVDNNPLNLNPPQEEPDAEVTTPEIKLLCRFPETLDFAIAMYILPEYGRASVKPLSEDYDAVPWVPVHLQPSNDGTEYRLWLQLDNGFMVFAVNRQTLAYTVLQSINMLGKQLYQGGWCAIVE